MNWYNKNGLVLNVRKTKETTVDIRNGRHSHIPLCINNPIVEVVSGIKFLGVQLAAYLGHSTLVKWAQ